MQIMGYIPDYLRINFVSINILYFVRCYQFMHSNIIQWFALDSWPIGFYVNGILCTGYYMIQILFYTLSTVWNNYLLKIRTSVMSFI